MEFAKVVDGVVVELIVATQGFVDARPDHASWVLTPFNPETGEGKVGIGYTYADGVFTPPAPEPPPEP